MTSKNVPVSNRRLFIGKGFKWEQRHTSLAVAPWIIYLAMPVSVSPVLILLSCAAALGVVVSVTVGSFKKYL